MYRKKKLFVVLLALMMVASIFAGCGQAATTPETTAAAASATAEATKAAAEETASAPAEKSLEEVTLRFYFFGDSREKVNDVYAKISETFKKELNAKFEVSFIPGNEYKERMIAIASSGDDYDMNFDGEWLVFSQLASQGAYMDIKDLLPKYAPALKAKYDELGVLSAATTSDGKVVGLPWTLAMNQRPYFGWNKTMADAAGVTVGSGDVKTFEDIDALLAKLYAFYGPDSGKIVMGQVSNEPVFAKYELVSLGFHNLVVDLNDPDSKVLPFEQTAAYLDRAKWAKKWNDAGYIPKDAVLEVNDGNVMLGEEILLSHFTWHEWKDKLGKLDGAANSSVLYPEKKFANRSPLSNVVAISANSANPERTLMFLDLVETNQQMYDLLHYGILDETYKLDGEKAIYAVDGMNGANSNYMEWGGQWALWKPQFMRPNDTYGPGFWKEEARLAGEKQNINSPLMGFFPKSDNIQNELALRDTIWALDKNISYGAFEETAEAIVQKMIDEQKDAGIDKIVADVQAQVDAFLGK